MLFAACSRGEDIAAFLRKSELKGDSDRSKCILYMEWGENVDDEDVDDDGGTNNTKN